MPIILDDSQFEELERSPRWSLNRESGHSGEREFAVVWDYATTFANAMTNAHFPNVTASLVQNISVEPFVPNPREKAIVNLLTDMNEHEVARVVIQYTSSSNNGTRNEQPDGTFLSYRQGTTVEYQTIPSRSLVWEDNTSQTVSPEAFPVLPISVTDHVITWSEIDSPPWDFISNGKGKVNSSSFDIPVIGLSVSPEQLLFEAAETNAKVDANGNAKWELTYTLKERQVSGLGGSDAGWNHQYRDDPAGWVKVQDKDNGNPTFASTDLSLIFEQA